MSTDRVRPGIAWIMCLLAACAQRPPPPPAPVALPVIAPMAGLSVLLVWNAPVDLDLYLTDPTSETAYFANTPTRTGTRLVRDARCGEIADSTAAPFERAQMTEPIAGRYRVGVDFIDACGSGAGPVRYRVIVDLAGARREVTGTIVLEEFQPIVLEFEVRRTAGDGTLSLVREED
jgi:hypothetical protein